MLCAFKIYFVQVTSWSYMHIFSFVHKCKWDESKPNYNVFIKIFKKCKDTEKMIALKNNRVDKWNSKWNKMYLWFVFRWIQIWSLWWFWFYVIWHCTYTNDGLLHCFHSNIHVIVPFLFFCICERHDFTINDRACVWFRALWKIKKKKPFSILCMWSFSVFRIGM